MQDGAGPVAHHNLTAVSIFGAATMIAGSGGRLVLQFLMLAILARILTPADFGLVGATTVVMGIGEILVTIGFGAALVQRPDLTEQHIRTAFSVTIVLGIALTTLTILMSDEIAGLFRIPELSDLVKLGAFMLLIKSSAVVAEALLFRKRRFKALALVLFISNFIGLVIVGLPLALAGFGAWSLVAATITTAAVTAGAQLWMAGHPKKPMFDRKAAGQLMRYGGGQSLSAVFNSVSRQVDNLVVGRVLGAEALGLYGRAYQIMSLPGILIGDAIQSVFFPVFSNVQTNNRRLSRGYRTALAAIAIGVAPASVLLAILAPELILLVLGPGWEGIVTPLQILAAAMVFRVGQKVGDAIVKAKAAVYRRAFLVGMFALSVFLFSWAGTPWGLTGVAIGVLVAIVAYYVSMSVFAARLTETSILDLIATHRGGAAIAAVVGAIALPAAYYLRTIDAAPITIVIGTTLAAFVFVSLVVRTAPRTVLGSDGLQASAQIFDTAPQLHRIQQFLLPVTKLG